MKNYFKKKVPNTKEWVYMKALAIQRLRRKGLTYDEISEIVNLSKTNCHRLKNREISILVLAMFDEFVEKGIYPVKNKSKIEWKH
jgi:hypothetical protein